MKDVIKVLSGKSLSTMVKEGGTGHWKLSKRRANNCRYVVVVRNLHAPWSEPGVDHHTAFLIGKVSGVFENGDRHVVQFNEYADISIPDAWDGSRNPVAYTDLSTLGIVETALEWKPFPRDAQAVTSPTVVPLNFEQAKLGLAAAMGVRPDQIEITVKA